MVRILQTQKHDRKHRGAPGQALGHVIGAEPHQVSVPDDEAKIIEHIRKKAEKAMALAKNLPQPSVHDPSYESQTLRSIVALLEGIAKAEKLAQLPIKGDLRTLHEKLVGPIVHWVRGFESRAECIAIVDPGLLGTIETDVKLLGRALGPIYTWAAERAADLENLLGRMKKATEGAAKQGRNVTLDAHLVRRARFIAATYFAGGPGMNPDGFQKIFSSIERVVREMARCQTALRLAELDPDDYAFARVKNFGVGRIEKLKLTFSDERGATSTAAVLFEIASEARGYFDAVGVKKFGAFLETLANYQRAIEEDPYLRNTPDLPRFSVLVDRIGFPAAHALADAVLNDPAGTQCFLAKSAVLGDADLVIASLKEIPTEEFAHRFREARESAGAAGIRAELCARFAEAFLGPDTPKDLAMRLADAPHATTFLLEYPDAVHILEEHGGASGFEALASAIPDADPAARSHRAALFRVLYIQDAGPSQVLARDLDRLSPNQRRLLRDATFRAMKQSKAASAQLVERVVRLGFDPDALTRAKNALVSSDITLNFHVDQVLYGTDMSRRVIDGLLEDGVYRTAVETGTSCLTGVFRESRFENIYRREERKMFGPNVRLGRTEHLKYAAFNLTGHPIAYHPYGSSALELLRGILARSTVGFSQSPQVGTVNWFDHVLDSLPDDKLAAFLQSCLPSEYPDAAPPRHVLEVQIHGPLALREDASCLRAHAVFEETIYQPKIERLAAKNGLNLVWTDGPVIAPPEVERPE